MGGCARCAYWLDLKRSVQCARVASAHMAEASEERRAGGRSNTLVPVSRIAGWPTGMVTLLAARAEALAASAAAATFSAILPVAALAAAALAARTRLSVRMKLATATLWNPWPASGTYAIGPSLSLGSTPPSVIVPLDALP